MECMIVGNKVSKTMQDTSPEWGPRLYSLLNEEEIFVPLLFSSSYPQTSMPPNVHRGHGVTRRAAVCSPLAFNILRAEYWSFTHRGPRRVLIRHRPVV